MAMVRSRKPFNRISNSFFGIAESILQLPPDTLKPMLKVANAETALLFKAAIRAHQEGQDAEIIRARLRRILRF
jgi:hypothetical protein